MTKQKLHWIAGLACLYAFYSCGSYNCSEAQGLRISTIGLTATEIDTIILRKFIKGSAFTKLVDSIVLTSANTAFQFPYSTPDTSFMGVLDEKILIRSPYDYEIYIPAVNKLTKIAGVDEPQQKIKRGFLSTDKTGCINSIVSYQQDGQTMTLMPNHPYPEIYIRR